MSRMNSTACQRRPARTAFISVVALFPLVAVSLLMTMQILGYWAY